MISSLFKGPKMLGSTDVLPKSMAGKISYKFFSSGNDIYTSSIHYLDLVLLWFLAYILDVNANQVSCHKNYMLNRIYVSYNIFIKYPFFEKSDIPLVAARLLFPSFFKFSLNKD